MRQGFQSLSESRLQSAGKTVVWVAKGEQLLGIIAFIRLHLRLKIKNIKKNYNLRFVTQNTLASKVLNHTKS